MFRKHFDAVACKKDGSFVLGGSSLTGNTWDGALWSFDSWHHYQTIPNLDMYATPTITGISDIKWFNNLKLLVAADSGDIEVWHVVAPGNTLESSASLSSGHHDMVLNLCVTNEGKEDGGRVISAGADGWIIIWDVLALKQVVRYRGHIGWVTGVDSHPHQSDVFISTGMDNNLKIWDSRQQNPVTLTIKAPRNVYCQSVSWSKIEDNIIASGDEGGYIFFHDLRSITEPLLIINPHKNNVHRLMFSPNVKGLLASVSDDCSFQIHHLPSASTVFSSYLHNDFVHGLSWQRDSSSLLTCGWDGRVFIHEFDSNTLPLCTQISDVELQDVPSDESSSSSGKMEKEERTDTQEETQLEMTPVEQEDSCQRSLTDKAMDFGIVTKGINCMETIKSNNDGGTSNHQSNGNGAVQPVIT